MIVYFACDMSRLCFQIFASNDRITSQAEKVRRNRLEKLHLKTSMQCQLFASENALMRKRLLDLENKLKVSTIVILQLFASKMYSSAASEMCVSFNFSALLNLIS